MFGARHVRPHLARLSLIGFAAIALIAGLSYPPVPAHAQGSAGDQLFVGCIQSVDQLLTQDQDRMQTQVYLRLQDPDTRERLNFGFYRNGIRAGSKNGSHLQAREFADDIEPILRQLREAARDRVHVEMTYDSSTQYVSQFRILYDRSCQ